MYKQVLVPLDGSDYGATALPHAAAVATSFGGRVLLVRVINTVEQLATESYLEMNPESAETSQDVLASSRHGVESLEARNHLERVKRDLEAEGIVVETAIREGPPAEEILAEAAVKQVDLIVLTAYGLGGAHILRPNAVFGSVADSVLRESRVPVLVIRP